MKTRHDASKPRLLDQLRHACRVRHFSPRTEEAYCLWSKRFILFHEERHPSTLGEDAVARFLSSLASDHHVSASTQNQALCAIIFLYRVVLARPLANLPEITRVRTPPTLPVVLTRAEVRAVLGQLSGVPRLAASLLYGAGLRLLECLELRVKDLDLERGEITVRQGKGRKDRITMLPSSVFPAHQVSPARDRHPARDDRRRPQERHHEARHLPQPAPFVRHALAGRRL
jgi:integrase